MKLMSFARSYYEWRQSISSYEYRLEEHIIKYQLWHQDCWLKEIYSYSIPAGKAKLKHTNKYPTEKQIKEALFDSWDSYTSYKKDVVSIMQMYSIEFGKPKVDMSSLYIKAMDFVDNLCKLLSKGRPTYNQIIDLIKQYL